MTSDFRPWIRPTLIGPFLTTWAFATLGSIGGGGDGEHAWVLPNGERLDQWIVLMLSASVFASVVVVGLIAADLVLLRARMCALPSGASAWTSSLLAPIAVWITWSFFGWGDGSLPMLALMAGWPILAAPLALRLVLGARP
jgi:hypothetical protein